MSQTNLQALAAYGQSIWLDFINRPLLESGKLQRLIDGGLRGMTSNPTIFNQAISQSQDYDALILKLKEQGKSLFEIYDELTIRDIKEACDIFRPVYDQTHGLDGYVSLEINPKIANDAASSIKEGMRLYAKVGKPNVMIKVPATDAGYPVVEELIASGINVNVTLIFSLAQYSRTVDAYLKGLSRLSAQGKDVRRVRSVASVFVSRIDAAADKQLDDKINQTTDVVLKSQLAGLKGKAAVANCRVVFDEFKRKFASTAFGELAKHQANEQRVLWASTGTKNPQYNDVKYVSELIAKPTVNTLPEKTLEAFQDHGQVVEAFNTDGGWGQTVLRNLQAAGIDVNVICSKLLQEGVVAFEKSFDELMTSLEEKSQRLSGVRQ